MFNMEKRYRNKIIIIIIIMTFANILFFEHQKDIFNAILRIAK